MLLLWVIVVKNQKNAKESAVLRYALPKRARLVVKNSLIWKAMEDKDDPALLFTKLGDFCYNCQSELVREKFIVGINNDIIMSRLMNSAVKTPKVSLEDISLMAKQYESTMNKMKSIQNVEAANLPC